MTVILYTRRAASSRNEEFMRAMTRVVYVELEHLHHYFLSLFPPKSPRSCCTRLIEHNTHPSVSLPSILYRYFITDDVSLSISTSDWWHCHFYQFRNLVVIRPRCTCEVSRKLSVSLIHDCLGLSHIRRKNIKADRLEELVHTF